VRTCQKFGWQSLLLLTSSCYLQDPNPKIPTGMVEVVAEEVSLLNAVQGGLPLAVAETEGEEPKEDTRLKNRVLDLRCETHFILSASGFLPLLTPTILGAHVHQCK
jgi:aspartyl-tRNA synthetase